MSVPSAARHLPVTLRFALRELRGGLRGFYVFIACIALGVAAIASVGSVSQALQEGVSQEGQVILGGDVAVSLIHREADQAEREVLGALGRHSEIATMRAMARVPGSETQTLAELKAVDGNYPLYGNLEVVGGGDPHELMAGSAGRPGLLAERGLSATLGIEPGDAVRVGQQEFTLAGFIESEPDQLSSGGPGWGPRMMMSVDALHQTGLLQPGSLVRWWYRIALPEPATDAQVEGARAGLEAHVDEFGWQVRTRFNAAPGLSEQIARFSMFLTLVGLTALIVGGVGVANAVNAYIDSRRETIATLKSLGAPGGFIFRTYLLEMMLLACGAMLLGLAFGAITPWLAGSALSTFLPVADAVPAIYPLVLLQAAAYGGLTTLAFALWPLGRAREVPVSALFRDHVSAHATRPAAVYLIALAVVVASLAGLAILLAHDRRLALYFIVGAAAAFIVLRVVALGIMALARRAPRLRSISLRLAVAAIHRPGAVTPSVVLSLGLGLTLLVAVALVDGNLTRQLTQSLPDEAPSFFFVDIPRDAATGFREAVAEETPEGRVHMVPMMRGRIVSVDGTPASELDPPPDAAWVLRGDRGITYSAWPPAGSRVVAGEWWPSDYDGPPLVSFAAEIAEALGLDVGDEIEVNVLGRPITAEVANLREVNWQSLSINFVMVFSPNTFAGAPHMLLSTVTLPDDVGEDSELALMQRIATAFPSITSVRVRDALQSVNDLVRRLSWGVRAASAFTLVAGILVLAGALAASHRHRTHDAVVLKTLGASRGRLVSAYAMEFAMLGGATALFALGTGSAAAWVVVTRIMGLDFAFLPWVALAAVAAALVFTIGLGLAGTWRVLGRRPAAYLRQL